MQGYLNASNVAILNKIRQSASLEYKDRVPVATQANLARTARTIRDYPVVWNEFIDILVNRIGLMIFNNYQFSNPLAPFKSGMSFGSIAMEVGNNLIQAENFDLMDTNPWTATPPDMVVNYYVKNRNDVYGVQVNDALIAEAMESEGQLAGTVNMLYNSPAQSAAWDEYQIMLNALAEYENGSTFANFQVSDLATSSDKEADGKTLVEKIRSMYLRLNGFYSRDFNAEKCDSMASNMLLLLDASVAASVDVNVLASAFNLSYTDFVGRQVIIDKWPDELKGTQAILADGEFFRVYDILNKSASIYNPKTDSTYTYLHCRGIYATSKQRNAVRFSTDADNIGVTAAAKTVTGVTIDTDPAGGVDAIKPGDVIQLVPKVAYSDSTNDANAYFIVTAGTAKAAANGTLPVILPDTGTYVDRFGALHISKSSTYETIVVTAVASKDPTKTANITLGSAGE